ncbi:MAG: hypothetical protein HYT76_00795 [Deltaproteobacteria bacterium]|nr:hypothetical protein [Deltaproteobacteria bacterium]
MSIDAGERENISRWNLSKDCFFESYVVHWADPGQEMAASLRYILLSPQGRDPEATVWGHFFDRRDPKQNLFLKETFPLTNMQVEHEIFYFSAGASAIFQSGARGELKNKTMSWELKFLPPTRSFRYLPAPFYHLNIPAMKWIAPQLSFQLNGELKVRDKVFSFPSVIASQVHLWGKGIDDSWTWGHCRHFREDKEAFFEGLCLPVTWKRRTMIVPLLYFFYHGNEYLVRDPVAWLKSKSSYGTNQWHFEVQDKDLLFIGDFSSPSEVMTNLQYEDPRGSMRQVQFSGVADLKIQISQKNGKNWRPIDTLTAEKSAFFETGTRKP